MTPSTPRGLTGRSMLAAAMVTAMGASQAVQAQPTDAPPPPAEAYSTTPKPENVGATPVRGDSLLRAFHGPEGIQRIADRLVDLNTTDPRIADIFKGQDLPHLKTMLGQQFCYILGGPCQYTGKSMKEAHKDMGIRMSDFNALVENLQKAMDEEHVSFAAQNRLLAKLAPMERDTVDR
jgi:hemoglobin